MKKLLLSLTLVLASLGSAVANTQPAIIFSQDVVAINADGSFVPQVKIDPATMAGMQIFEFDLGRSRQLRIETNIRDAKQRGLADVVATIERSYAYVEAATGLQLDRGVLLYLIELEELPYAYNFSASYDDPGRWGEVRLALIERGAPLSGRHAAAGLTDLLYDTLPHELGHDVLDSIPQLLHDIDGQTSHHTRWFIEGVCELLAKGFSEHEVPAQHRHFLAQRNVETVLSGQQMQIDMLTWAQSNDNGMVLESDLYGAAMLTLMAWTESLPLTALMAELTNHNGSMRGTDLVTLMYETSGIGLDEMLQRANRHGLALKQQIVLARNSTVTQHKL